MEVVTVLVLARAFSESLGNQGAPVVEEILENFANSLISVTLETGELVEFSIDLENMMKRTKTSLLDSLKDRGIPFILKENIVLWKVSINKNGTQIPTILCTYSSPPSFLF